MLLIYHKHLWIKTVPCKDCILPVLWAPVTKCLYINFDQKDIFLFWFNHTWKLKNWKLHYINPNSYCRHKSSTRGPRFKVSSEGLSAEINIYYGHQSKYKPRTILLNPIAYLAVGCISIPITTHNTTDKQDDEAQMFLYSQCHTETRIIWFNQIVCAINLHS